MQRDSGVSQAAADDVAHDLPAHSSASDAASHAESSASETRARELGILKAIAEALNSATDVQQALEHTLALVADLLGLRTGWVWLLDPETTQFYLAAAQDLPPYLQEPVRMTGGWCLCTDRFRRGRLAPTNIDVLKCSRLGEAFEAHVSEATLGLRYHASIPLAFRGRKLGIINIAGPSWRRLTPEELQLLETIAYQVGIAVERARLAAESALLARAAERARLAREIHDTLAQGLTAIALDVEGALRHLESNPKRARERLQRALETARENLEEARRSVLDLRAAPLAGRPLLDALEALGRTFTSETGVRVRVRSQGESALPLRVEAELFRIAQEAMTNVRKHAQASEVTLGLRVDGGHATLTVEDNGVGFEAARKGDGKLDATNERHGIVGMRERARLLGGTLRITSRPGNGTRVSARVPLVPSAREDGP